MSEARRGRVLVGDGARGDAKARGTDSVAAAVQVVRGACSDAVARSVCGWRELKRAPHLILPRQRPCRGTGAWLAEVSVAAVAALWRWAKGACQVSRGGPRVGWEGEGRSRSRGGAVARVTRVAASMGRRCGVERACGSPGVALQAVMTGRWHVGAAAAAAWALVTSWDEGRRTRGECAGVGCGANVRRL